MKTETQQGKTNRHYQSGHNPKLNEKNESVHTTQSDRNLQEPIAQYVKSQKPPMFTLKFSWKLGNC